MRGALQRMSEGGEVARFYRSLGTTFSSGLSLTQALGMFEDERAKKMSASLASGGTLSQAAKAPPFLALEHALLELGEESGNLVSCMALLASFFEADHRLSLQLKSKAIRPLLTLLVACFVLPLPVLVRFGLSAYLATSLPMLTLGLLSMGSIMWAAFTFFRNRPRYAYARMLWAIAISLEAGLPLERAVRLAAAALGDGPLATRLLKVPPSRWQGRPLSETLPEVWPLPKVTISTLQVMEKTGDTKLLHWLARNIEDGTIAV